MDRNLYSENDDMSWISMSNGDSWQTTINEVMPAIVVIQTCRTLPFGGTECGYGTAIGTVVDSELGIILTSKSATGEGPTDSRAIFCKGAGECPITLHHPDPLHDWSYWSYNVTDVKDLGVKGMQMRPELIEEGLETRVFAIGRGKTLNVHASFINRTDCNPPAGDACKCPTTYFAPTV